MQNFLILVKLPSDLGTDASDRKMDVEFVISDPENPQVAISNLLEKFFWGGATLVQECRLKFH